MIRGLVPKERLLEWSAEDGWEPLCKFLGKEVPNEPFPRINDAAGFAVRVEQWFTVVGKEVKGTLSILGILFVLSGALLSWGLAPQRVEGALRTMQQVTSRLEIRKSLPW